MSDIFLLEDDALLAQTLIDELEEHGYRVAHESSGDSAAERLYEHHFALLLLDINTPGMRGLELLEALRNSGDETPAIFLTALAQMDDLKAGFDAGANDYITKPFNMQELLIRMRAKLPKHGLHFANAKLQLDPNNHTLINNAHPIHLPPKEYTLLHYFFTHHNVFSAKEAIEEACDEQFSDATFRVYIKNLKKVLSPYATLSNKRSVGYRLEAL